MSVNDEKEQGKSQGDILFTWAMRLKKMNTLYMSTR